MRVIGNRLFDQVPARETSIWSPDTGLCWLVGQCMLASYLGASQCFCGVGGWGMLFVLVGLRFCGGMVLITCGTGTCGRCEANSK